MEIDATSFQAPADLPGILKAFYQLCPKFKKPENVNAGAWRKFLSPSQFGRIRLAVSPHIVVQAESLVNLFVVEEVKASIKQGVKSVWEWTVETKRTPVKVS